MHATVADAPDCRFDERVEVTAYFVVAEALTNVAKHAHASDVRITATRADDDLLVVEVTDDGVGATDLRYGSGLLGLHDRTAAIGGTFMVDSQPGDGTVVRAVLPCG